MARTTDVRPIRVICGTIKDRAVTFKQVVMENDPAPEGILLVRFDPERGISLWLKPFAVVEKEAKPQAVGYSREAARAQVGASYSAGRWGGEQRGRRTRCASRLSSATRNVSSSIGPTRLRMLALNV